MRLTKEMSGEYRIGNTGYYIRYGASWEVVWYENGHRRAKPRTWETKRECMTYARQLLKDGDLKEIEEK